MLNFKHTFFAPQCLINLHPFYSLTQDSFIDWISFMPQYYADDLGVICGHCNWNGHHYVQIYRILRVSSLLNLMIIY